MKAGQSRPRTQCLHSPSCAFLHYHILWTVPFCIPLHTKPLSSNPTVSAWEMVAMGSQFCRQMTYFSSNGDVCRWWGMSRAPCFKVRKKMEMCANFKGIVNMKMIILSSFTVGIIHFCRKHINILGKTSELLCVFFFVVFYENGWKLGKTPKWTTTSSLYSIL